MQVVTLLPSEWKNYSEHAHMAMFGEIRPSVMERLDFCIVIEENGVPLSYATIRELDNETVYMQYGGAFPPARGGIKAFNCYLLTINKLTAEGYKRITTLVENKNIPMIKFALKLGFLINGVRIFKGDIYCEFLKEFKED